MTHSRIFCLQNWNINLFKNIRLHKIMFYKHGRFMEIWYWHDNLRKKFIWKIETKFSWILRYKVLRIKMIWNSTKEIYANPNSNISWIFVVARKCDSFESCLFKCQLVMLVKYANSWDNDERLSSVTNGILKITLHVLPLIKIRTKIWNSCRPWLIWIPKLLAWYANSWQQ